MRCKKKMKNQTPEKVLWAPIGLAVQPNCGGYHTTDADADADADAHTAQPPQPQPEPEQQPQPQPESESAQVPPHRSQILLQAVLGSFSNSPPTTKRQARKQPH